MGFPAAKPSKNLLAELSQSAFKFMNNEVTMDALAYNLGISDFIRGFNEFLRNCMIQKTGESAKLNLSENSLNWLQTGCRFSTADFLRMLDLSLQFESKLRFLQQPQISLEALFTKL